jgi:hypothetical protein
MVILGIKSHNMLLCCDISFTVNLFLQEDAVKKKYGGRLPKKPPLISKVFFSSLFVVAYSMFHYLFGSTI